MKNNYQKLFSGLKEFCPHQRLRERISARIEAATVRSAKIHLFIFGSIGVISLAGLIPAFQYLVNQFSQSGFYSYFSLIFSDGGVILTYWKEFMMLLAETLPVIGILIFLSVVFVFLGTLRVVARNLKDIFSQPHFIN